MFQAKTSRRSDPGRFTPGDGCGACGAEDVAPYPKSWVPGSAYSADFAIQVAHEKHVLNIPLARQEVELEWHGAFLKRHTLFLDDVDEIFAIEQQAKEEAARNQVELIALRTKLRSARSRQIVEGPYERSDNTSPLAGTAFDKALNYLVNQRRPLERFLEDPRAPLTNNHAERLFRSPAQGRKAHQASRSMNGD